MEATWIWLLFLVGQSTLSDCWPQHHMPSTNYQGWQGYWPQYPVPSTKYQGGQGYWPQYPVPSTKYQGWQGYSGGVAGRSGCVGQLSLYQGASSLAQIE